MSVKENLLQIKNSIPSSVTLVAVSKTKPNELILEAYEAGQRDFGENYVQELVDKHEQLSKDIRWHFIGHLQSNKVKYIASFVYLIHGVDSLKLLQEINKQAIKNNRIINCLLQIFIATEETKFGLSFEECEDLLNSETYKQLKNVNVVGFMAMASNTDDEERITKEFNSLKNFQEAQDARLKTQDSGLNTHDSILNTQYSPLTTLSFGMSNDYKLAIKAGSNMVRLGSSIFGERNYIK